ncbi:(R)-specific enoyl-CoA hydratase [compost metagenome]
MGSANNKNRVNLMNNFRARAAEGLQVGDSFAIARTFTDEEIELFARISRDYNPVHFDHRYAETRNFRTPICHGLLTASLVTEIGGQIGWLASGMNFRFRKPVYPGETVICRMVITEIDQNCRAKASVVISNEDEVTVLEAEISGVVPGPEERAHLRRMLAEGDPTNAITRPQ